MVKKSKEKQVRTALAEAVKLLCTRELNMCYRNDFLIQGLLGITLDSKDIILIDINEVVKGESMSAEKGDTEILKHETEISRILSKGNSVDATGDSIRNILDTNIPQETKNLTSNDLETTDSEVTDKQETVDLPDSHGSGHVSKELSKKFDINQPFIVSRSKSSMKLSQSLLKRDSKNALRKIPLCQKPQICYLCGIATKNMYGLKNHLATVHNEGARYTCDVCSKGFLQRQSFEDHINAHKGKKAHRCAICGKSTPFATSMRRHMRNHRMNPDAKEIPRPYQCSQCESKFKTELSLKEHINIEHLDRRIRCGCGQEFKWRSAFARHKSKCLLAQYSVTDPNPQKKRSNGNNRIMSNQPSRTAGDSCKSFHRMEKLGPDITVKSSESEASNDQILTHVTASSGINIQFVQNPLPGIEAAGLIRERTESLAGNRDSHTLTLDSQKNKTLDSGMNQCSQILPVHSSIVSQRSRIDGSSTDASNTTPVSTVSFPLVTVPKMHIVTKKSQHHGYVTSQLTTSKTSSLLPESGTLPHSLGAIACVQIPRTQNQEVRPQILFSYQDTTHINVSQDDTVNRQVSDEES